MKNQIIDIDGYIHVVNGKVICFKPDVYDLDNPNDVADLVLTSFEIGVDDKFPLVHGNDTILFLDKSPTVANELIVSMGDFRGLPEDVQKKCKLAVLKQKNQIIDIDGYVHVVNGKVICFKPDVYDLDNPEDVQNVLDTVVSLFGSDSKLQVWFDDNTFVVLERSDAGNVVVGMGDVLCLPEGVQEKVEGLVFEYRRGKEVDIMSTIKPIQATPELSGKDAMGLLRQVNAKPAERAVKHNDMLRSVLADIRKR